MTNKTFAVCTLGCKVNSYESDCISAMFEKEGLTKVPFDSVADIYLINTCSVTNTGDKKSRQAIHRARRQNPNAFIAVCGCYAQIDPDAVKRSGADLVAGTSGRGEIVRLALSGERESTVCDISVVHEFEELNCSSSEERTRAYIKIQDGCNNFCSYCIIPYTRGRIRSRSVESTLKEIARLKKAGFSEIVLTGIEVASYGRDLSNIDLISLLERISSENPPERIRLSSIDPRVFTHDFIVRLSKIPQLCRHFHISAQSGCDATLERMNRHYTAQEFLDILKKIRTVMPDAGITTDIITGFPGETDEEFAKTREFVKRAAFSRLHVFPYSERRGTRAAEMEQIPVHIRTERAKVLIEDGKELMTDFAAALVGTTPSVLFEQGKNGVFEGYSGNYVRVFAESREDLCGKIRTVKITKATSAGALKGIIIDK